MSDANFNQQEESEKRMFEESKIITQNYSSSPSISKLAAALALAQLEMIGAVKDSQNPFFRSTYADLASVLEAVKACNKQGIATIQMPFGGNDGAIGLTTLMAHSSGEWLSASFTMKPTKADPQGFGSCLTYMRRYAISAFNGVAQVDDDGNDASRKPVPENKQEGNGLKILPRDGCFDDQTPEMKKKMTFMAEKIMELVSQGDVVNAVGILTGNGLDNMQIAGVADKLDSKTRAAVKKVMLEQNKSKRDKIAELRDAQPPSIIEDVPQ